MHIFGFDYTRKIFGSIDTLKFDFTPETLPLIIFKALNVVIFPNELNRSNNIDIAHMRWFLTEEVMIL